MSARIGEREFGVTAHPAVQRIRWCLDECSGGKQRDNHEGLLPHRSRACNHKRTFSAMASVSSRTFPNLTVLSHPLIQHKLTILRDKRTSTRDFKQLVNEIAMLMAYEVTKDLPLEAVEIETPLEKTT